MLSSINDYNDLVVSNHTQEYYQQRNESLEKENHNQKAQIAIYNSNIAKYLLQNSKLHQTLDLLKQYLNSIDSSAELGNELDLPLIDNCQPLISKIKQDIQIILNKQIDNNPDEIQFVSQLSQQNNELQLSQVPDNTSVMSQSLINSQISQKSEDTEIMNIVSNLNNYNSLLTNRSIKLQEMHQQNKDDQISFLLLQIEEKQNMIDKKAVQIQELNEKYVHYCEIIQQLGNCVKRQHQQMISYFNLINNMNDSLNQKCKRIYLLVDQCNLSVVQNKSLVHEQTTHTSCQINYYTEQMFHLMRQQHNDFTQKVNEVIGKIQNIPQKLFLVQEKYNKKNLIFNEFKQLKQLSDKIDNNLIEQLFQQYDVSLRDGVLQFSFEINQLSNSKNYLQNQIRMIQSQLNIALKQLSCENQFEDIEHISQSQFCECVQENFVKPLISYHAGQSRAELEISNLKGQIQTFQINLKKLIANLGLTLDITLQHLNDSDTAQYLFTEIYDQIKMQLFEKQQQDLVEIDEQAAIIKQFAEQIQTLRQENTKLVDENYKLYNQQLGFQQIGKQFTYLKELVQNIRKQYNGYHEEAEQRLSNVKQQNNLLENRYNDCLVQLFQLEQDKALQSLLNEELQEQLNTTKFDLQDTDLQVQKLKQSCEELKTYRQISGNTMQRSKLVNSQVRPSDLIVLSNEQYLQQICYLQQLVATKEAIIKDLKRYIYESEQINGDSEIVKLKNTIRRQDDLIFELQDKLEGTT